MLFFIVKCLGYQEIYIQGGGRKHFTRHFGSQTVIIWIIQSGSYEANKLKICINKKFVLWYLCPSVRVYSFQTFDLDLVSEKPCTLPGCWCRQNNRSCIEDSPIYRLNQNYFCCKCWLHSLEYMTLIEWFWYLWPKMAFKMPQEFPSVSLDITLY